ncbi:MAG: hypothetical protein K5840_05800 [Eubacterium sp.]|nr:hypothetical protein [Eubacterium sp.]
MLSNGEIIPIKIRFDAEDGSRRVYLIESYKDLSHRGTRTTGDGVYVTNNTLIFDCHIHVYGKLRSVRLYYDPYKSKWFMAYWP